MDRSITILCSTTTIRPLYTLKSLHQANKDLKTSYSANIAVCADTTSSLAIGNEVEQAEQLFQALFPGEVFLPPRIEENEEEDDGAKDF
jgi:hypothetical protein